MGELYHYGRKGMKWGQRLYQNKDGSLTALGRLRYRKNQKSTDRKRKAALEKARKAKSAKKQEELSVEEQRKKLLKSTDADLLYKNRKLLTTAEINERLNRIDTERRLSEVAAKDKKTGMDRVNSLIKTYRKVDEIYQLTQTPLGKAIAKKLGLGGDEGGKSPNLDKIWKNLDNTSDEALNKAIKRANSEKAFKKLLDEQNDRKREEAQRQVDAYNQKLKDDIQREIEAYTRSERSRNSTYRQAGEAIVDRVFKSERVSNVVNDDSISKGSSYISGLLDAPVERLGLPAPQLALPAPQLALPAPSDDKKK